MILSAAQGILDLHTSSLFHRFPGKDEETGKTLEESSRISTHMSLKKKKENYGNSLLECRNFN